MASNTSGTPSAPHGVPSFARRHPILTGFGILAGVSLFASYFPISAMVTGAVVVFTATGADHVAMRAARRIASVVATHWRARTSSAPQPHGPDAPAPAVQGVRRPERELGARHSAPRQVTPRPHVAHPHAARPRRSPRVPSPDEHELAGL